MAKIHNLIPILIILTVQLRQTVSINKLYSIVKPINYDTKTTEVKENSALGQCTCDKTLNSCDIYCCCDQDCSKDVIDYWNTHYNYYCTRNYVGNVYKPFSQCVDMTHIYSYNQRMGMQVSENNGQMCVELDTGSLFSGYVNFIDSINSSSSTFSNDLSQSLYQQQSYNSKNGLTNAYQAGDKILA